MTSNHIDQLAEWWENAEGGVVQPGDTVIGLTDADNDAYEVFVAQSGESEEYDFYRILSRAPKPKPAWHDAVAVIAHTDDGHIRQVWERDGDTGYWCGTEGYLVRTEKLRDVTPLIEAKVADEMHDRVRDYYRTKHRAEIPRDAAWLNELLTVALGLEAA